MLMIDWSQEDQCKLAAQAMAEWDAASLNACGRSLAARRSVLVNWTGPENGFRRLTGCMLRAVYVAQQLKCDKELYTPTLSMSEAFI
jgi:hypothetical protein